MTAPVALFVYNKVRETRKSVAYLKRNRLVEKTDLIIYSDAPASLKSEREVAAVRSFIRTVDGFNSVEIVEWQENKGLAASLTRGVSEVINNYGSVIVLEDDLLTAPFFLHFMNESLKLYCDDHRIWSIAGYSPLINIPDNYSFDTYLAKRICSWGWATWQDRWQTASLDISLFDQLKEDARFRNEFNEGGNDLLKMLELEYLGKINSWAIRWNFDQYLHQGYTVYPLKSLINNIGFGSNATHTIGGGKRWEVSLARAPIFPNENLSYNPELARSFKKYYNLRLDTRIGYFLRKHGLFYRQLKKLYSRFQ